MRVGGGVHLVAGGIDDEVLPEQVVAGGVGLEDGADELRLQYPVVGVDGGDARLRVRVDDGKRAVELGQQRIEGDDGGPKILLVAIQRGVEVAHDIAQVRD